MLKKICFGKREKIILTKCIFGVDILCFVVKFATTKHTCIRIVDGKASELKEFLPRLEHVSILNTLRKSENVKNVK